MWLNSPISNSNYNRIDRFDILVDIVNTMKSCHVFYVSVEDGYIYGTAEEAFCLHRLPIPDYAKPTKSFSFRYDTIYPKIEMVKTYRSFVILDGNTWCAFPIANLKRIQDYIRYWDGISWSIKDKITGAEVEYLDLCNPDNANGKYLFLNNAMNSSLNKRKTESFLSAPMLIDGLEKHPMVLEIMSGKITVGRKYLEVFGPNGRKYEMQVFKNLFNLNKDDKLDVIIRDRLDNVNIFEACFLVKRKKNPIQYIYDTYVEEVYTQFIHL